MDDKQKEILNAWMLEQSQEDLDKAFRNCIDELEMGEAIDINEHGVYWSSCGESIID
jgi:hypothetical protein